MEEKVWYVSVMGDEFGPISDQDLIASVSTGRITADTQVRKGTSGPWRMAGEIKGLLDAGKRHRENAEREKEKAIERESERLTIERERLANMVISTGSPPSGFEVVDIVFAVDSAGANGFFAPGMDASGAFEKVKQGLKMAAFHKGADAVFNCHFEYRDAVARKAVAGVVGAVANIGLGTAAFSGMGQKELIEIFAYGTAVKLHQITGLTENKVNSETL
jgi:uncharacterized protein YbjQ (UPF0145 family)